ncbi:hypothetical protein ABW19_dt0209938 [Dactylella cylindrospora]|nr:hypothetical protein ABW19_dt0209938 [Dactylella cylindrospora]
MVRKVQGRQPLLSYSWNTRGNHLVNMMSCHPPPEISLSRAKFITHRAAHRGIVAHLYLRHKISPSRGVPDLATKSFSGPHPGLPAVAGSTLHSFACHLQGPSMQGQG